MGNQPSFFVLGAQEHLDEPDHFAYTLNVTSPAPVSQDQRVGELHPAPYNPRTITSDSLENLANSIREFGDISGVVYNTRTSHLVGGHQRVKILDASWKIEKKQHKDKSGTVAIGHITTPWGPFSYREVDWPIEREMAANISANKARADFDAIKLAPLLVQIDSGNIGIDLTGFSESDLKGMVDIPGLIKDKEDEVPPVPKTPVTKVGDVWMMGDHRLICGDSRDPKTLSRIVEKSLAVCMWTDPPYGVDYVGKTKDALRVTNDGRATLDSLISDAFSAADKSLAEGAAIYIAHPPGPNSIVFMNTFVAQEWRLHETLIWCKDSMVLGHSDYHYKHEPILFGYKKGGGRRGRGGKGWYGNNAEVSTFSVPRPKASEEHPTMKPVQLIERMVMNSSPKGGLVIDPFLGSGSTLIACWNSRRRCCGVEIDPRYCDVIVERWEALSGEKAKRR